MTTKVAALVGPTATGKTTTGVAVAERLGAEIVSVDSMQVYRRLDAGTAKPSAELRGRVTHHLVDVVDPNHVLTVADYQARARSAIAEIQGRGRLPLLVGGSGLYFRAIVDDLRFPPRSPDLRRRLEDEARKRGPSALHERLRRSDPAAAARIEPTNLRRVIRALEVMEMTSGRFSDNAGWHRYESIYELVVAGLRMDRAVLDQRIAQRVDVMLEAGLVEEALALKARGFSMTAGQALGYRQVLDNPHAPAEEVRKSIIAATRRFARRQESWFRADPRVAWFEATSRHLVPRLVEHFAARLAVTVET